MTIERTFGAVGADFATWEAMWVWLNGVGALGDNYLLTQIDTTTENGTPFGKINCNGYDVLVTTDTPPNGDPTVGHRINLTNGAGLGFTSEGNGGALIMDGLQVRRTAGATGAFTNIGLKGILGDTTEHIVRNCLFKGRHGNDTPFDLVRDKDTVKVFNCKIWNMGQGLHFQIGSGGAGVDEQDKIFENITIYNCVDGVQFDSPYSYFMRFRNVVACGSSNLDWRYSAGNIEYWNAYNCADSDGTLAGMAFGVNSIGALNIVPADEFVSLVDTVAGRNFLWLNDGFFDVGGIAVPEKGLAPLEVQFTDQTVYGFSDSFLGDTGTAPGIDGHDTDIEGLDIPNPEGFYSIGCHQGQIV